MATNGVLGTRALLAGVPQAIYVCNNEQATVLTLNVVNKNTVPAKIRVSIGTSATNQGLAEFLEFETELLPKGVLERTGLIVSPNSYLIVKADVSNCNAVCYGVEVGNSLYSNTIQTNTGVTPTWVTSDALGSVAVGGVDQSSFVTLYATDINSSQLTYTVTGGSLPNGTVLQPNGLIAHVKPATSQAGLFGTGGQSTSFTATASNGTNTSVPKTFYINKIWYDGSSPTLAARNAQTIKDETGSTANQFYWLNLPGLGPTQIYCDLQTDGKAWMRMGFAGSVSGVGNSNQMVFNEFGDFNTSRSYGATSFSRFGIARAMGATKDAFLMWRRINDPNVIVIHTLDELANRLPGAIRDGNRDMNGTGSGYPITTMRMSASGVDNIVHKANSRYESGPSYPGIAWNSAYNDNSDNVGSYTTYLNRRSIIYWETNGVQSGGQWFHGDPLQLGPARGPYFGQSKLDIEVYFAF